MKGPVFARKKERRLLCTVTVLLQLQARTNDVKLKYSFSFLVDDDTSRTVAFRRQKCYCKQNKRSLSNLA